MKHKRYWITGIIIAVIGIVIYWRYETLYPSTDDAYVQANVVNVATQVSGPVDLIAVVDHQAVTKNQLLFTIDPLPFEIAVKQAQAQVAQAQAQLDTQSKNTVRIVTLVRDGQLPKANGDDAEGQLEVDVAQLALAKQQLAQAQLNLSYTQVTAPASGYITQFTLRKGQYVVASNPLFELVENHQWWVDANFKETDLERIHPGQPAKVEVDIYPGVTFNAVVQGISAGSGAAFALLPPENATGNWVKVTQRFPVRVNIINPDPKYPLRVGASSVVTVNTRHHG